MLVLGAGMRRDPCSGLGTSLLPLDLTSSREQMHPVFSCTRPGLVYLVFFQTCNQDGGGGEGIPRKALAIWGTCQTDGSEAFHKLGDIHRCSNFSVRIAGNAVMRT